MCKAGEQRNNGCMAPKTSGQVQGILDWCSVLENGLSLSVPKPHFHVETTSGIYVVICIVIHCITIKTSWDASHGQEWALTFASCQSLCFGLIVSSLT